MPLHRMSALRPGMIALAAAAQPAASGLRTLASRVAATIQLGKVDLGEMRTDWDAPCAAAITSDQRPKKKYFPTIYVDRISDPIDLPNSGTGKVVFRVRRRETSIGEDGVEKHGTTIEIQSIETEEGAPKQKVAKKETKTIKLGALRPGMIELDDRPRNGNGQFEPQSENGIDPSTMAAAYGTPDQRRQSLVARFKAGLGIGAPAQ